MNCRAGTARERRPRRSRRAIPGSAGGHPLEHRWAFRSTAGGTPAYREFSGFHDRLGRVHRLTDRAATDFAPPEPGRGPSRCPACGVRTRVQPYESSHGLRSERKRSAPAWVVSARSRTTRLRTVAPARPRRGPGEAPPNGGRLEAGRGHHVRLAGDVVQPATVGVDRYGAIAEPGQHSRRRSPAAVPARARVGVSPFRPVVERRSPCPQPAWSTPRTRNSGPRLRGVGPAANG